MTDHLFPRYHVRPQDGYVNDPNGPVVLDGLVHLYFQSRSTVDTAEPVRWGHVSSTDLVRWEHHPPALAPHPHGDDRDGCWSGNTVVDDDGAVRAFYSGYLREEPLQATLCAVSTAGGRSFGPPRRVVDDPPADDGIAELRDPFVWREGAGWRMALGAGTVDETALVRLYGSDDLETWTHLGPLARMTRTRTDRWDSGAMWECPQVVRLDGTLVVLVGSYARPEGVMDVLSTIVPDGSTPDVTPSALHLVDDGPNFYAPSVLADSRHGALLWGWATEGRSWDWTAADGWSGMLTLPRVVSLRPDGSLASTPVPGLSALRVDQAGRDVIDGVGSLGAQLEFLLGTVDSPGVAALRLCCGPDEYLEIFLDADGGLVRIDRDHASRDPRADRGVVTVTDVDGLRTTGVRGFVDGSILELFLPGGRAATTRFYPTCPPPWRLEWSGSARARVWELRGPDTTA